MDLHPGARLDLRQIDPAEPVVSSGRQRPIRHERSASLPSYLVADHLENRRAEIADIERVTDHPRFCLAFLHFLEDARQFIRFQLV